MFCTQILFNKVKNNKEAGLVRIGINSRLSLKRKKLMWVKLQ